MRVLLGLAALALVAAPATAHEREVNERYSAAYNACNDAAGATAEYIRCADAEFRLQDAALNAAYRRVMATLNARQQEKLRKAQRAWIAWRDAKCQSLQDQDWGSLSTVTANFCMVDETIARLIELEEYPPV